MNHQLIGCNIHSDARFFLPIRRCADNDSHLFCLNKIELRLNFELVSSNMLKQFAGFRRK
jgi:hypothetical protein